MTLHTVQVSGSSTAVEIYAGMTALDDYILSSGGAAYLELEAGGDERKQLAIKATRYLDRKRWRGTANGADSTMLKFPRDGLTDEAGDEASNEYQLDLVRQAVAELMMIGADDESIFDEADQSSNIKEMGAGKARLVFWGRTSTRDGTAKVLPTAVHELIGRWLAGGGSGVGLASSGGASTGTCGNSYFGNCDGYKRSGPF